MFPSTSSSSTPSELLQNFLGIVHSSRKLLLHTPLPQLPDTAAPMGAETGHDSSDPNMGESSFDGNDLMVLSVLLCALICGLGLNSIIRYALRCSSRAATESGNNRSTRLGVARKALKTFPTLTYSAGLKLPGLDSECVICLSEFASGERVRVLPKCNHGFHVRCIDKWLMSHSSCPTCRHCPIESCEKISIGCSQASSSEPPPQRSILPLEPEGLIHN
ncbi:hypothetical protein HHK36_030548 [Tetracentron sinense]|uniref:RING-type domain-containing protein n=1 Tax=Tetracentron sinense TaxID=13715 RepID=A0A834YCR0_TETSI|nr:hypothetical protein HHK36_030548 [Tetracentron sinense]